MARIDVTRVLRSREFVDHSLLCTRNAQAVGNDGIAVNTPTATAFSGVVTSDQGDILNRLPEGAYISGSITIHTTFRLIDGRAGEDADIVTWNGARYTVTSVNDYSSWGAGFVAATCEPLALSGS